MSYPLTENDIAYQLRGLRFEGTIIPDAWHGRILSKAKPDMIGMILLADIVRWYSPKAGEVDPETGESSPPSKKYKSDLVQLSRKYFVARFGYTKDQVKRALVRLEDSGFIKREMRVVKTAKGKANVPFIWLNASLIKAITLGGVGANLHGGWVQICTEGGCKFAQTYTDQSNTDQSNTYSLGGLENESHPEGRAEADEIPKQAGLLNKASECKSAGCTETTIDPETGICGYCDFISTWVEDFPKRTPKPTVRGESNRKKFNARMKDDEFKRIWKKALKDASGNNFVTERGFFTPTWFLKNDENWRKFLRFVPNVSSDLQSMGNNEIVEELLALIRKFGYRGFKSAKETAKNPRFHKLVTALGGWSYLCEQTPKKLRIAIYTQLREDAS